MRSMTGRRFLAAVGFISSRDNPLILSRSIADIAASRRRLKVRMPALPPISVSASRRDRSGKNPQIVPDAYHRLGLIVIAAAQVKADDLAIQIDDGRAGGGLEIQLGIKIGEQQRRSDRPTTRAVWTNEAEPCALASRKTWSPTLAGETASVRLRANLLPGNMRNTATSLIAPLWSAGSILCAPGIAIAAPGYRRAGQIGSQLTRCACAGISCQVTGLRSPVGAELNDVPINSNGRAPETWNAVPAA